MNQDKQSVFKKIFAVFDKFEDEVRGYLSHYPIIYAIIGGVTVVLFWRGVWHTADILMAKGGWLGFIFYEPINLALTVIVMLATGLFVASFIGDAILISGLKKQKKTTDKTEKEVKEEESELTQIRTTIKEIKKEVDEIKGAVDHNH